ncbi:MAG: radical SAM protein [Thermodesulfobacteriota bacterium]
MSFLFINVNQGVGHESSESIPISLGYVLAELKTHGWNGVIIDDLRDRPLTLKNLETWIARLDPRLIGFTTYQSTMERIRFLCRYIKSRHRRIHIVFGGPQAMLMPSEAIEDLEDADALVRGEGELVALAMAEALDDGLGLEAVDGITCRCGGRIQDTDPGPEPPDDLDEYASPYLTDLLNLEGKNTATLLFSRGCRHTCRFCVTPRVCQGKTRYHSVERVIEEMEFLARKGIERFCFADPKFTENPERTERLLEEKIRRGIATPFWCQTRGDLMDKSLLRVLKKAGADTIAFGLESGSPSVLENTDKRMELEQLRNNIQVAQSLGIEIELFSIFGLPGEAIEDARTTMRFVQSLGIPVESNSVSQQMQLYFGSVYQLDPERFGIITHSRIRRKYISAGDQYETSTMSQADLRKVRNLWVLSNEQLKRDLYHKQGIFEIIDFLLENREDLEAELSFHEYGALACASIEEFPLLEEFLDGYAQVCSDRDMPVEEIISALSFFRETGDPIGPTDRVIFDSLSYVDGIPFTSISGKFWDVLLGQGLLFPSFEEGFFGAVQGQEIAFSFMFPNDYFQKELRDKTVEVQATIHKVFQPVEARTIQDVRALGISNRYEFADLDLLQDHNEILYYLALRNATPSALLENPSHFFMLAHRMAKLGKRDEIRRLAALVQNNPPMLNAFADTLVQAGKCSWASEYFEILADDFPSSVVKRVRCLLGMGRAEQATNLLYSTDYSSDLEFQEIMLECLKATGRRSERIPSLDHHVMDMRVETALRTEVIALAPHFAETPVVHGEIDQRDSDE